MAETGFPIRMVRGVPVVTAPEEIDITNAPGCPKLVLGALLNRHTKCVFDMASGRKLLQIVLERLGRAHLERARPGAVVGIGRLLGLREGAGDRGNRKCSEARNGGGDPTHGAYFVLVSPVALCLLADRARSRSKQGWP